MSDLAEMGRPLEISYLTTSTLSVFLTLSPIKSSLLKYGLGEQAAEWVEWIGPEDCDQWHEV